MIICQIYDFDIHAHVHVHVNSTIVCRTALRHFVHTRVEQNAMNMEKYNYCKHTHTCRMYNIHSQVPKLPTYQSISLPRLPLSPTLTHTLAHRTTHTYTLVHTEREREKHHTHTE